MLFSESDDQAVGPWVPKAWPVSKRRLNTQKPLHQMARLVEQTGQPGDTTRSGACSPSPSGSWGRPFFVYVEVTRAFQ